MYNMYCKYVCFVFLYFFLIKFCWYMYNFLLVIDNINIVNVFMLNVRIIIGVLLKFLFILIKLTV